MDRIFCERLFLSTPSARRATGHAAGTDRTSSYFYPRPPRGGRRLGELHKQLLQFNFYPRPPRGGRPAMPPEQIEPVRISIHALREEGDVWVSCTSSFFSSISIHALREEGDSRCLALFHLPAYFYPRPPRGGRPLVLKLRPVVLEISIHALREEGDSSCCARSSRGGRFLSTLSARRATREHQLLGEEPVISIHALREEGDRAGTSLRTSPSDFYPRPPRGGRRDELHGDNSPEQFLSTPSARRATTTERG